VTSPLLPPERSAIIGEPGRVERGTSSDGLVVSGVGKTFRSRDGATSALADVSFTVPRGRFFTIIGPSGSGKSTLLRIVAGLLEADQGDVVIFGESGRNASANKQVGFVPQSPALLPWRTVLENVRLPLQVNRKASERRDAPSRSPEEILSTMGLGDVLDKRPAQLSGGMQQRVAIARAFAFDPAILLMDEPFSSLDELTRELLRHQLLDLWESDHKTVLFVTHSVTEAVVLSDMIVVMSAQPGRVQALVPVSLPRPRGELVELTDEFHAIERQVRLELRSAWGERSDGGGS
jgi:NitT/TauT family transport system ATP-binding protein